MGSKEESKLNEFEQMQKDIEKKSRMRIKGLLKTYLTEDESHHNIHHYWKIFSVDPAIKKSLLKIILLESKNLEQIVSSGKTKIRTGTLEYIMKLMDNFVISTPDAISQCIEILREFNVLDDNTDDIAKMIEELFNLIIIKWECLQDTIKSMDIINGNENDDAIKVKIRTIAGILKAFKSAKKSIIIEMELTKKYLISKEAESYIEYFNTMIS